MHKEPWNNGIPRGVQNTVTEEPSYFCTCRGGISISTAVAVQYRRTGDAEGGDGRLMGDADTIFPALVQGTDRDSTILGYEADKLLPDVLHVVVLSQAANVCLYCFLWRLTGCERSVSKHPRPSCSGTVEKTSYLSCDFSCSISPVTRSSDRSVS